MQKKRILIAFGTRPEALKFVPLIRELEKNPAFKTLICVTGQHRQMLEQVTDLFGIRADESLGVMKKNQTLDYVSGLVVSSFGRVIERTKPDIVFVQGDTATALMVGIASFYARKPVAHLEAGLRSWNKYEPYPEEMNRRLLSHIADLHFTPTKPATENLIKEGIPRNCIFQVGNTIVDTVSLAAGLIKKSYPVFKDVNFNKRIIFVTAHRRESFGQGMQNIFGALKRIVMEHPDTEIVYPVHLNPNVKEPAYKALGSTQGIHLLKPLSYEETYWIMDRCYLILTDSGGIQEEAPCFKKPALVLRNVTERTEGIKAGVAKLVGTDSGAILRETSKLLHSKPAYQSMVARKNPYGDGKASKRIVKILEKLPLDSPMLQRRANTRSVQLAGGAA